MSKYILTAVVLVAVILGFVWYQNAPPSAPFVAETAETVDSTNQKENDTSSTDPNDIKDIDNLTESGMGSTDDGSPSIDSSVLSNEEDTSEVAVSAPEADVPNQVTIDMDGFNYEFSVKEIRVKKGDVVTINLKSTEGFHDWVVDEFGAATERINEGGMTSVTFTADKVGTFQYYCSVGAHRQLGMVGYIIVEE